MKISGWKILAVENGWAVAPQCWWIFLKRPVHVERNPGGWMVIEVLGFAVFIERHGDAA